MAAPEEVERVKKSLVAFERDKKRALDVEARERKKVEMAGMRTSGQRFRVLRSYEIKERNEKLGFDPQVR